MCEQAAPNVDPQRFPGLVLQRCSDSFAEAWNGTSWKLETTASPSGGSDSYLAGVSCTSPAACTAVGYYYSNSSDVEVTLAEAWNGTSWSLEATPNPAGALASYQRVPVHIHHGLGRGRTGTSTTPAPS